MRWAVLAIGVVACGVLLALWTSGGQGSVPMLVISMAIVIICSVVPMGLSKRRPKTQERRETIVRDR